MRLACFYIPLFSLAARLRAEPELLSEAVVITEGSGSAAHVVAASRRARKSGIRAGMSLPQARAILPRLIARSRDEVCERSAHEALLEVAESFSPRVEDGGEGVAYFDLAGLEGIWGKRETRDDEELRNVDRVAETAPGYSTPSTRPPDPDPDPQPAIRNPRFSVSRFRWHRADALTTGVRPGSWYLPDIASRRDAGW